MKQEKRRSGVTPRFVITMLVYAALGGASGILAARLGDNFPEIATQLNGALASLGLWWFLPGFVLLAVGSAYYFRGKALLPQAAEDDSAFREADRRLCLVLIFSNAGTVWMFAAIGIGIQAQWANQQAMWLGSQVLRIGSITEILLLVLFLVIQMVWIFALQAAAINATKIIHPEKRGSIFDTKFQTDWYRSCDEAEQQQIGQCSYFTFRLMNGIFPIIMLLLFFLAAFNLAQPGWVLLVGGLWMAQLVSYQGMAYHLDHGKKRGSP